MAQRTATEGRPMGCPPKTEASPSTDPVSSPMWALIATRTPRPQSRSPDVCCRRAMR
jgi:hypothetical protein